MEVTLKNLGPMLVGPLGRLYTHVMTTWALGFCQHHLHSSAKAITLEKPVKVWKVLKGLGRARLLVQGPRKA